MGRSINRDDSVQQLLPEFKDEIRKYRKRERELVKHFKNEIRMYKKKHPNKINNSFEIALKRVKKKDAKKNRSTASSIFNFFFKKTTKDLSSVSETEDEEDERNKSQDRITAAVKLRSKVTTCETICGRKDPKNCKRKPVVHRRRLSKQKKTPSKLSVSCTNTDEFTYRHFPATELEFVAFNKEFEVQHKKQCDLIDEFESNTEKSSVELSVSKAEPGLFVINIPSWPVCNNELKDEVYEENVRKKNKKQKKLNTVRVKNKLENK